MPTKSLRRGLAFTCSRRNLWPALLQEIRVIYGSIKGGQGGQLSQLRDLDDDRLAKVRPMLNPEYEIVIERDYVCPPYGVNRRTFGIFTVDFGRIPRRTAANLFHFGGIFQFAFRSFFVPA